MVMGIVNVTPDSFHSPSRVRGEKEIGARISAMAAAGADIIDIGGCSTRPGSSAPSPAEETSRVVEAVRIAAESAPETLISVDTYRAEVAEAAVAAGAHIINDISAGILDRDMIPAVARLKVPYIMMHMRGTPETMASLTDYPRGVTAEVITELSSRVSDARAAGICDIIIDPGFGFAKTPAQCRELLRGLPVIEEAFRLPVLVGLSRKSMLWKPLGLTPAETLPATIAADTIALGSGAAIVRVHDVAQARQMVDTFNLFNS